MASGRSTYESFDASDLQLHKAVINEIAELRLASARQYEKIFSAVIDKLGDIELQNAKQVYTEKLDAENKFISERTKNGRKMTSDEINQLTEYQRLRKDAEEKYYKSRQRYESQTSSIAVRAQKAQYDKFSAYEKAQYQKTAKQRFREEEKQLVKNQNLLEAMIQEYTEKLATASGEEQAQLTLALEDAKKELVYNIQLQSSAKEGENIAEAELAQLLKDSKLFDATTTHEQKGEIYRGVANDKESEKLDILADAAEKIASIKEEPELEDTERDAKIKAVEDAAKKKEKQLNSEISKLNLKASREEEKAAAQAKNKQNWSPEGLEKQLKKNAQATADAIGSAISSGLKAIDDNVNTFYEYQSKVEARLQGSDASYQQSLETITKNVAFSGFVKQKDVINHLVKLVDSGVAYNIDSRAFLATISEDIASTFDALEPTLLKIIRIQQADTTAARLGMEASLTKLFNEYFSDTSYLSDAFDKVSDALSDASVLKSKDDSLEFEYMVQKWLGSLYSLGLSDSAADKIAKGLSYIGTGNIEALNSDESLQTLMAMSASQSGLSYAELISGGLDADNTNKLLKGMIEYLKLIADNTDSNVVTKSAYANLFGITTTDLRSIQNITQTDLDRLYSQSLTYNDAITELESQTSQIAQRTHISQILSNVFDNALMSASTTLANQSGVWGTWMTLNLIEDLTGGIAIPTIMAMGSGIDLETTVTALAKTGIAGYGLMDSLLSALASGNWGANFDLGAWDFDEYTSRGKELSYEGIKQGAASGISRSEELTNSESFYSDIQYANFDTNYSRNNYTDNTLPANEYNKNYTGSIDSSKQSSESNILLDESVDNTYNQSFDNYDNSATYNESFDSYDNSNTYNQSFDNSSTYNQAFDNSVNSNSYITYNETFESNYSPTYTSSASAADLKANSLAAAAEQAQKDAAVINSSVQEDEDIYNKIYNAVADDTSSVISRINELHNNVIVNGNALKVDVDFKEAGTMAVQIDNMSDMMKKYLDDRIHTIIAAAFADESVVNENGTGSIVTALKAALDNINVTVTNDFFDSYYQKQAFTT